MLSNFEGPKTVRINENRYFTVVIRLAMGHILVAYMYVVVLRF